MAWSLKVDREIGILELDQPGSEVNILTTENLVQLKSLLQEIANRKDLRALLFTSAKGRIFIAGADIREIQAISTEDEAFQKAEQGKQVLQRVEDLPIPTVAVIGGACLGGGFELALSCSFRVASFSNHVKIGLPEVNLGILPGFGGSIRLPRQIGLLKALPLILSGKMVSAAEALKLGMVDRLFPEKTLHSDAILFARGLAGHEGGGGARKRKKSSANWFLEQTPWGRYFVFRKARQDVLRRTKGFYAAPLEILRLIEGTCGRDLGRGFLEESRAFSKLAITETCKNLIQVFFATERYKKFPWTDGKGKGSPVHKCGIIGAGVMGGGIAQRVSERNIPVRLKDIREEALGHALGEAHRIYQDSVKRKRLKRHEAEFKMGVISAGLTDAGLRQCDIILEAVVEDLKIKQRVFQDLGRIARPEAVLASNTSSLSVAKMAEGVRNPERVVGLHFFNPVHRMPLVEVIRAPLTSTETLERTIHFARALGKTVVVVKDSPGFLVNRLLMPYMNEAAYLMEGGLSPEIIDRVATSFGMPMGPVELMDQVGIDVGYKVAHVLFEAFGQRMQVAPLLEGVKSKGLLGKKSGRGFYVYEGKAKRVNPDIGRGAAGTSGVTPEDALKRMFFVMINEAVRCLDEGIVPEASTVDIGMMLGAGFPPFRGGLLRYADSVRPAAILRDLERFEKSAGDKRFEPAALLRQMALGNSRFYSDFSRPKS